MARPFRFGSFTLGGTSIGELTELARKAEDLGFSTLTLPDHFDGQLAAAPALAAVAGVTTTLRIGTLVYANDYRHPVVLAKEAATLDVLSEGRFELGLGAGWMTADYEQSGIAQDGPGTRIERLDEAIDVLDGLFADGPFTYEGEHYRIGGLDGLPKPVQRPRPPLMLAGGGRRMLGLAARRADIVGINVNLSSGRPEGDAWGADTTRDRFLLKAEWVREAAGRRFDDIELHCQNYIAMITDDREGVLEETAPIFDITPDEAAASPQLLIGSVDEVVDQLEERRELLGISYVHIPLDSAEDFAPVLARLAGT